MPTGFISQEPRFGCATCDTGSPSWSRPGTGPPRCLFFDIGLNVGSSTEALYASERLTRTLSSTFTSCNTAPWSLVAPPRKAVEAVVTCGQQAAAAARFINSTLGPYATRGSNPGLAEPRHVCYSHVRASPWTDGSSVRVCVPVTATRWAWSSVPYGGPTSRHWHPKCRGGTARPPCLPSTSRMQRVRATVLASAQLTLTSTLNPANPDPNPTPNSDQVLA